MCKYIITTNMFAGNRNYGTCEYHKLTYAGAMSFARNLFRCTLEDFQKANAATWLGDDLDVYLEDVHGFDMEGELVEPEDASLIIGNFENDDGSQQWFLMNKETQRGIIIELRV